MGALNPFLWQKDMSAKDSRACLYVPIPDTPDELSAFEFSMIRQAVCSRVPRGSASDALYCMTPLLATSLCFCSKHFGCM